MELLEDDGWMNDLDTGEKLPINALFLSFLPLSISFFATCFFFFANSSPACS